MNQDFLVQESGKDLFMGGIGLAGNGTLHVAWTRSSASDDPSSYAAHQSIGDAANSISPAELLAAGTGPYTGERWGDYVGVAQDPQVPSQVWNGNQYSGGTEWLTKITPLRTAGTTYVPITRGPGARHAGQRPGCPGRSARTRPAILAGHERDDDPDRGRGGHRQPRGHRPDGGRLRLGHGHPDEHAAILDDQLPDRETFGPTTSRSRCRRPASCRRCSRPAPGKKTQLVFDVTGYFLADDSGATFTPAGRTRSAC